MRGSVLVAAWMVAIAAQAAGPNQMGGAARHGVGLACPMSVPGTRVRVEETSTGAALEFTTTGDVAELRHRVDLMAGQLNARADESAPGTGGSGANEPPLPGGHGAGELPASEVHVDAIQNGARLDFVPQDPLQLPALRDDVRAHAEDMAHGHCPILQMHAGTR